MLDLVKRNYDAIEILEMSFDNAIGRLEHHFWQNFSLKQKSLLFLSTNKNLILSTIAGKTQQVSGADIKYSCLPKTQALETSRSVGKVIFDIAIICIDQDCNWETGLNHYQNNTDKLTKFSASELATFAKKSSSHKCLQIFD